MYYCLDCGEMFEEPRTSSEQTGEFWGAPAWECFYSCPRCGSDEIDTADKCEMCGEWIPPDEELCDNCKEVLGATVDYIMDYIRTDAEAYRLNKKEFKQRLIEALDEREV